MEQKAIALHLFGMERDLIQDGISFSEAHQCALKEQPGILDKRF
jgi:hypothetical protein